MGFFLLLLIYDDAAAAAAAGRHVALAVLDQILDLFARDPSLRHVANAALAATAAEIQQIQQCMVQVFEGPNVASRALDVYHIQARQVFNLGQLDVELHLLAIVNALFAVDDVRGGCGGCCFGANVVAAAVAAAVEEELEWDGRRALSGASAAALCRCVCIGAGLVWHRSMATASRPDTFDLEIMAFLHINPHETETFLNFM